MKRKVFGFDLGIASIGWSAIEFDNEYFNIDTGEIVEGKILGAGVRTFPVAENPKDGSSLAMPRRSCRAARRLCRRKARRLEGIKKMFVAKGLLNNLDDFTYLFNEKGREDVWNLRVEALKRALSKEELLRVLIHLAKHRGFKSYRKAAEEKDEEGGKVLKAINANKSLLSETKTLAQIIVERAGINGKKRNYKITNEKGKEETVYINSIPRTEIERELDLIFQKQEQYGIFKKDIYQDFKNIAFRFKPFASVGNMVGNCSFEKNEKRASKNAPSAELFVALSKINNLTIYENNAKRFLNTDERLSLLELLKTIQKVKYSTIAKKIFKNKEIKFSDINYAISEKDAKPSNPEDKLFYEMKGWHKIKAILSENEWNEYSHNLPLLDKIVNIIACEKNDEGIVKGLNTLNLSAEIVSKFLQLDFDKFINLSLKALYKILPYMENGMTYDKACNACGYDFKSTVSIVEKGKDGLLKPIPQENQTTVPVVNRTVSQFRKVYNAMVRRYGVPDQINIETGRELKKSFDERKKIEKKNKDNQKEREEVLEKLQQSNIRETSTNVLKWRLYKEQDGKCIYSGKPIDINRLDETGYLEIDHILPYSRSLDDSYDNKVLCFSVENQKKSNKTPFEYLGNYVETWDDFCCRVNSMHAMRSHKKANLLIKNYNDKEVEFRERNANDNSYISRFVKQYLEDGVDFSNSFRQDIKNRIQTRTGYLTDYLRHCWGLKKDRDENDRHHAQDAIVIACATQDMVKYLSTVSNFFENKWLLTQEKGEAWYKSLKHKFKEPWSGFREDIAHTLDNIFVSRPPRKKATGSAHKDTISSKTNNISRLDVRKGEAIKEKMFRCDVYLLDKQYKIVPIYAVDLVSRNFHHYVQPYEKIGNEFLEAKEENFLFSLYKDDYIKITTETDVFQGYFNQYNAQSGQIYLGSMDNSKIFKIRDKNEVSGYHLDKEKKIAINTCIKFEKLQIEILGDIYEVKKESERFFQKMKSNAQKYSEKKTAKQIER